MMNELPILRKNRVEYAEAYYAREALQNLQKQIGKHEWLSRAIVACDALNWGAKVDEKGRVLDTRGKPMKIDYESLP